MLSSILQLLASLTILVLIHEFGHFITARLFKIRVEKFYMFFNPWFSLFKFKPKGSETEYGIGWLPLGGYVKIAGMIDESLDSEQMAKPAQPWEFRSHPAWQRLIVMVAGVCFNFILAIFIYSMIAFHWGDYFIPLNEVKYGMEFSSTAKEVGFQDGDVLLTADGETLNMGFDEESVRKIIGSKEIGVLRNGEQATVYMPDDFMNRMLRDKKGFAYYRIPFVADSVIPNSPADLAGMKAGDMILSLNDTAMCFTQCSKTFMANKLRPINMVLLRGQDTIRSVITPNADGKINVWLKQLTFFYEPKHISYGFLESIPKGLSKGVKKLTGYAGDMKYIFTAEGAQSMGGFISIMGLFPTPFDLCSFLSVTAFLSVILAFMNILPIPALDGGHALFLLYEVVARRKPSQSFMMKAQVFGMVLLLFLLLYVNMNDVLRLLFK